MFFFLNKYFVLFRPFTIEFPIKQEVCNAGNYELLYNYTMTIIWD